MAGDNWLRPKHKGRDGPQPRTSLQGAPPALPAMLSIRDAAHYWGVNKDKVLDWIRKGCLRAIDVRSSRSSRPQYRIPREAVEAFNALRCTVPWPGEIKEERFGRRASEPSPTIEYF